MHRRRRRGSQAQPRDGPHVERRRYDPEVEICACWVSPSPSVCLPLFPTSLLYARRSSEGPRARPLRGQGSIKGCPAAGARRKAVEGRSWRPHDLHGCDGCKVPGSEAGSLGTKQGPHGRKGLSPGRRRVVVTSSNVLGARHRSAMSRVPRPCRVRKSGPTRGIYGPRTRGPSSWLRRQLQGSSRAIPQLRLVRAPLSSTALPGLLPPLRSGCTRPEEQELVAMRAAIARRPRRGAREYQDHRL